MKSTPAVRQAIRIFADNRGIVLSMHSDRILFDPGSADIKSGAYPILAKIAKVIRAVPGEVRVEGHTCNLPPRSSMFPSNWELSTARAARVIRYLIDEQKVRSNQLSAAGYADTRPVVPNNTEENRNRNRRVDFIIPRRAEGQQDGYPEVQQREVINPNHRWSIIGGDRVWSAIDQQEGFGKEARNN